MKISLTGGSDPSRSVIASTARCLNLYSEPTSKPQGEPGEVTYYPTPGLTLLGTTPDNLPLRGLYRATNGDLYGVAGLSVYFIDATWKFHLIGVMNATKVLNPTKMADNGKTVILCDGTLVNGYQIDMVTKTGLLPLYNPGASDAVTPSSTGWLGSTFVDFTDTFFVANFPQTPTFYISNSEDVIFDPLQFAGKTSASDFLVAAVVQHRVIWLIGVLNSEIFYNTGGGDTAGNTFPFSLFQGVAIDWGCAAPYSIAKGETSIFWLGQHLNGETVVLRGSGYSVSRISTHALEYQISTYAKIDDAIGYVYMLGGHSFYVLNFPTADKTWVYDLALKLWTERAWTDSDGREHRQRSDCHAFAYGKNVVNDHSNGNLYALDLNNFTDNGDPVKRLIGFPRQIDAVGNDRINFQNFVAELDAGESKFPNDNPMITLDWSDDKGKTWSNGVGQTLGKTGKYNTLLQWNRLGLSRNRVFRLYWAADALVSLQAAFVQFIKAGS